MISKDQVYSQIETSGKLPTLPEVLLKLLAACDDRDSSLSDVADIISRDPALSLRVLQLVNSAYYGFRHAFAGIDQAVVYLGANTIKNLALTTSVHQVFAQKEQSGAAPFDTGSFWYHSLLSGTIAKRISQQTGIGSADEAYLAGLLHDIGKLLLISAFPTSYRPATELTGVDELRLESEQTGLNHCEAGSWLMRQWNLGSLAADAIQYHHEELEQVSEAFPLVKIVYLANILAWEGVECDRIDELSEALFGPDHFDIEECIGSSAEEVGQIAASMGIKITPPGGSAAGRDNRSISDEQEIENEQAEHSDEKVDHTQIIRKMMVARVKNISLLSAFQEDLMQAKEIEGILAAFEKSMAILFGLDKVLFFLPDRDGVLLSGQTSGANVLQQTCRGLTFPVKQSPSLIVSSYTKSAEVGYLAKNQRGVSIADQQILAMFKCSRAYPIPMVVDTAAVGVIVLGLPEALDSLTEEDSQLIRIIVQQVAFRLYLEQEKINKAEALNTARMEAISTTARKLAHEINNPLGIISNYLVTLKIKIGAEHNVLDELNIIDEEIQRISSMVSQMETYSQAPFSRFSSIDVNAVVRDIIQIAKSSLFASPGLGVSFIPGAEITPVTTSKDALKQVLINLLKNAAEAMAEGGRVIVRTRRSQQGGAEGRSGVEVIVADSGPGLPDAVMENLYKPFVTTKQNGHSGLGLSIVQKAVNDIGGKLSCSSSSTEGTTFTIFLPGTLPDSP